MTFFKSLRLIFFALDTSIALHFTDIVDIYNLIILSCSEAVPLLCANFWPTIFIFWTVLVKVTKNSKKLKIDNVTVTLVWEFWLTHPPSLSSYNTIFGVFRRNLDQNFLKTTDPCSP